LYIQIGLPTFIILKATAVKRKLKRNIRQMAVKLALFSISLSA